MSQFPSPRLARGGLVVMDPTTGRVLSIIAFQYNPDTLTRTIQVQGIGAEPGDRLEALRLKGPAHETIKLDAEFDATDALEHPGQNQTVAQYGLTPQLAVLENLVSPTADQLNANNAEAQRGTIEIIPIEAPMTLFVWSRNRVLPVRISDLSVTEEAFDTSLNPTRAKVSLSLRVLTIDDVGFNHRAGGLFLLAQRQKERLANLTTGPALSALGLNAIPGGS
jgi:hypothetical protein